MRRLCFLWVCVVGCASTHSAGTADASVDASGSDAAIDAGVDLGYDGGETCGLSTTEIAIVANAVEGADWSDEECGAAVTGTTYFDGTLTSISADAAHNGIVLRIDRCPNADADCRCDYTIANIRADVAASGVTVPNQIRGQLAENAISLQQLTVCECAACPCASPLFFFAARAAIGSIPVDPGASFGLGATTCSDGEGLAPHNERQSIAFGLFGLSTPDATVDEGETVALETGFAVRVINSHEFVCPPCGGVGPTLRSWAAWRATASTP